MATITLPGLSTGIDTGALIKQLMAIEQRRYNSYSTQKTAYSDKLTNMNTLDSKLVALRTATKALSSAQQLASFRVSSSDNDVLTATASTGAFEGSHSVEVNQLATAERLVHTTGLEYAEDYVGAGSFIYSYNNQEVVVTTTASTTLEDLVGLINNDGTNPGVTASLLYYANSYHLVLNGNSAGSDYSISVNASNTELWQAASALTTSGDNASEATKLTALDQFTGTLTGTEAIVIQGTQHDGTAVNYNFSFNGNMKVSHLLSEIENAFGGTVKATLDNGVIKVTDTTCGTSQMTISLSYDAGTGSSTFSLPSLAQTTRGGSIVANLSGFAEADFTETQTARDCQIRVDGYPAGDWITRSSNTVTDVIPGVTLDLQDTGTANVTVNRDSAALKSKMQTLVDSYNDVTQFIKENSGYDASTRVAGIFMGNGTVSSIREAIRDPLIMQAAGFLQSIDDFTMAAHIGLTFDKDGLLSFDTTAFDNALAEDHSAVLSVIGADKSGTTDSNYIKFYSANSTYTTAGTYNVEVTVSGGAITSARIKLSTETEWRDATWTDNVVTGSVEFDERGYPAYPENGLQLSVDLSQTGTMTANVRVKGGFAGTLYSSLNTILKSTTGSIKIEEKYLQTRISDMQLRMDQEQKRLDAAEERLVAKFARLEKTLSLIQQQLGALTQ